MHYLLPAAEEAPEEAIEQGLADPEGLARPVVPNIL